jgi:hypothetical protein
VHLAARLFGRERDWSSRAAWMRGIAYRLLLLLHRDWFGMGWTALAYAWMDNDTGIRDYKHELSLMHVDADMHP